MTTPIVQSNEEQDYVRLSCNHILEVTRTDSDSEHFEPAASEGVHPSMGFGDEAPAESSQQKIQRQRAAYIRVLALLCACSLSVGSH